MRATRTIVAIATSNFFGFKRVQVKMSHVTEYSVSHESLSRDRCNVETRHLSFIVAGVKISNSKPVNEKAGGGCC